MSEVKKLYKLYPDGQVKEESVYKDDKLAKVVSYLPGEIVEQVVEYHDNGKMSKLIQVKNVNEVVQKFNEDEELHGFAAYKVVDKKSGITKLMLSYTNGKFGYFEQYLGWNYVEVTDDNDIRCNIDEKGKLRDTVVENRIRLQIDENGVVTTSRGKFQFVVEGERVVKKDLTNISGSVESNLLKLLPGQFDSSLEGVHKLNDKFVRVKLNSDKTLKKIEFL